MTSSSINAVKLSNGVEKSANDDRNYRVCVLNNELTCLLIQDATTDKAAAAMDVKVGHFSDPPELPGLAHFLEHMLFLGTEKYPDENSYSAHLSSNGGNSNAFTSTENTNYHFDVVHSHLESTLDRFAQFFIAPLFTAGATDRELKAVDSENAKNLQNDQWRFFQLMKSTARKDHPMHKFGTGNLETLKITPEKEGIDVRKALLAFHERHYSANLMKLVVLGREDLDTLEKWVREKFSAIRNTKVAAPSFEPEPWKALCKRISVVPIKDLRYVRVTFPLPQVEEYWMKKPLRYLSHLLGHESAGSVLALLKTKGWANELYAGPSTTSSCFAQFEVTVEATDDGLENADEIVSIIFQYIAMLKSHGADEEVHKECAKLCEIDFKFKSKRSPMSYCSSVAGKLHKFPPNYALSGGSLLREFDANLINRFLSLLDVQSSIVFIAAKNVEKEYSDALLEERWYKTKYHVEPLSQSLVKKCQSTQIDERLHMPHNNPFLPDDLSLRSAKEGEVVEKDSWRKAPELIVNEDVVRVWYKKDNFYNVPKLSFMSRIIIPGAWQSPEKTVMLAIYQRLITDELTEFSYFASLAGLHYELNEDWQGLTLAIGGFNDKIVLLLEKILHKMVNFEISEKSGNVIRFEQLRKKLKLGYEDFALSQPYEHTMYYAKHAMTDPHILVDDKLFVIDGITPEKLNVFSKTCLRQLFSELLIFGNVSVDEAKNLVTVYKNTLNAKPLLPSQYPNARIAKLERGSSYIYKHTESNKDQICSAIRLYYQIGMDVEKEGSNSCASLTRPYAILSLLMKIMNEPCYDQLRTKEQLGYLVWSGLSSLLNVYGAQIIIQSDKASSQYLEDRILLFLHDFRKSLVQMTLPEDDEESAFDEFKSQVNALLAKLKSKPKTLFEEAQRHWIEIVDNSYMFDRRFAKADLIESITREELLNFFDTYFKIGGAKRACLVVCADGNESKVSLRREAEKSDKSQGINDLDSFQRSSSMFPCRAYVKVKDTFSAFE
eukprot:g3543.t1